MHAPDRIGTNLINKCISYQIYSEQERHLQGQLQHNHPPECFYQEILPAEHMQCCMFNVQHKQFNQFQQGGITLFIKQPLCSSRKYFPQRRDFFPKSTLPSTLLEIPVKFHAFLYRNLLGQTEPSPHPVPRKFQSPLQGSIVIFWNCTLKCANVTP